MSEGWGGGGGGGPYAQQTPKNTLIRRRKEVSELIMIIHLSVYVTCKYVA